MNKAELSKAIVDKSNYIISLAQAEDFINTFIDIVKDAVIDGDTVNLVGFGTFKTSERKERQCKNPQTKEIMTVPASTVPTFKAGKAFKDAVNNK